MIGKAPLQVHEKEHCLISHGFVEDQRKNWVKSQIPVSIFLHILAHIIVVIAFLFLIKIVMTFFLFQHRLQLLWF